MPMWNSSISCTPVERITRHGQTPARNMIRRIIIATGFDAVDRALSEMDIGRRSGLQLKKWRRARHVSGLQMPGFRPLTSSAPQCRQLLQCAALHRAERRVGHDCIRYLRANKSAHPRD